MNKKKIVQFILIIFLLLLTAIFYIKYFQVDNKTLRNKKETKMQLPISFHSEFQQELKKLDIIKGTLNNACEY